MNRFSNSMWIVVLAVGTAAADADAQCDTCATPVVAYQPVAVQQTVTATQPKSRWYPGRLFDRMRMRRWSRRAEASTTTYATTTAYAPYTVAYAPATATVTTASYAPYVTAYAPLARTVVARPAVQTTFYRPVVMRPVVAAPTCSTCAYEAPACCEPTCCAASPCASCSGATTAVYSDVVSSSTSDCVGCAAGGSTTIYSEPSTAAPQGNIGPPTPRPALKPDVAASETASGDQWQQGFEAGLEAARRAAQDVGKPVVGDESSSDVTPGPAEEEDQGETGALNTYPGYPKLFAPSNDRTARRPTVKIHDAVYRGPGNMDAVSGARRAAKTQAELDAQMWGPVRRNR